MKRNDEFVIIFKTKIIENDIFYEPIKLVFGTYNNETKLFIDSRGNEYDHIITMPQNYGFAYRNEIVDFKKKYPLLPLSIIKYFIVNSAKKLTYEYVLDSDTDIPVIIISDNKKYFSKVFLDTDITLYYGETNPELLTLLLDTCDEENDTEDIKSSKKDIKINININEFYDEISSYVIDKDEPVKQILTAIWKQYNNFSENKSRNIFINGSTGVGKTEIFRVLSKIIGVPIVITSATDYSATGYVGRSVTDMLVSLLERANGDLERAERGILVIDEIDKLANTSDRESVNQRDVQEGLLKILEDGKFVVRWNNKNYEFDTSRLLVVGMGSFSRISLDTKVVGFEKSEQKRQYKDLTRNDFIENGMIPEFIGRFPIIVQMNELDYYSFLKILDTAKNNALALNKSFFERQGIKLTLEEGAKVAIAKKASKENFGARGLDEIIDRALSIASFEIAKNPELYEELIITEDTIKDNKSYKLVRKIGNN